MLTVPPKDICTRAIERFGSGSLGERLELSTWLAGINFALLHHGPCRPYIERLNSRLFDIPAEEFGAFAEEALEGLEGKTLGVDDAQFLDEVDTETKRWRIV
jgi:hypothetical protein